MYFSTESAYIQYMKHFLLSTALILFSSSSPVSQSIIYDGVVVKYYTVDGASLTEVVDNFGIPETEGYAAFASYYITRTAECEVILTTSIIMPTLSSTTTLSLDDRQIFNDTMVQLLEHEMGHVRIAEETAKNTKASNCSDDSKEWSKLQELYDKETNHGRTQGS